MSKLSVVLPAYNEELMVGKTCRVLAEVLTKAKIPYELVVVNDGSGDRTWEEIQKAGERDANVTGVLFSRNFAEFDKDNGFTVLDAGQVNDRSVDDVIAQVKQIVGDMPVYLTFDIDCLDPAFAPGTGTPVIGGLTSDRAIKLVRGLKDLNIVGMDVVEVAPAYDQSEITALAAATLALEMLYIQAAKKGE